MTIAALRALLDEIDEQGGPEAARRNQLPLPDERTPRPMDTTPPARADSSPAPTLLPVGKLLYWADAHLDAEVQDQSARARAILAGLRKRYDSDHERAAIATEAEELEKRLAELRAREAQLAPPKPRRASPGYSATTVRAWAKDNGIECPPRGRIPSAIVERWRAATATTGGQS